MWIIIWYALKRSEGGATKAQRRSADNKMPPEVDQFGKNLFGGSKKKSVT